MPPLFSYSVRKDRTRTHLNATRMSVARCGWTQRNLYFLPRQKMQIESYHPHQ